MVGGIVMKTIKERAKEYSLKDFDGYYTGREKAVEEGYIAGVKDQQYIDKLFIEQLIDIAWSLANSMYQTGKDNLIPLTKDEFIKLMKE